MLLHNYKLEIVLPECNPFAQTVNAIAKISDNISEVLPYLASIITPCNYDDRTKILTFKKEGRSISIYPSKITITKLHDNEEAKKNFG